MASPMAAAAKESQAPRPAFVQCSSHTMLGRQELKELLCFSLLLPDLELRTLVEVKKLRQSAGLSDQQASCCFDFWPQLSAMYLHGDRTAC